MIFLDRKNILLRMNLLQDSSPHLQVLELHEIWKDVARLKEAKWWVLLLITKTNTNIFVNCNNPEMSILNKNLEKKNEKWEKLHWQPNEKV